MDLRLVFLALLSFPALAIEPVQLSMVEQVSKAIDVYCPIITVGITPPACYTRLVWSLLNGSIWTTCYNTANVPNVGWNEPVSLYWFIPRGNMLNNIYSTTRVWIQGCP